MPQTYTLPFLLSSSAKAWALSLLMSAIQTLHLGATVRRQFARDRGRSPGTYPRETRSRASSRPIPEAPPVMRAKVPDSSDMILLWLGGGSV
jgi:hypothetical protein